MLQVLYIRKKLSKIQMFITLIDWSNAGSLKIQIVYCFNADFKHVLLNRNLWPDVAELQAFLSNDFKIEKQNTERIIL